MNKALLIATSIVILIATTTYIVIKKSSIPTLRIYNSFFNPERIGELARTAQFLNSKLKTVKFTYPQTIKILDALPLVSTGAIDGAITSLYYWGAQDPTLYLISSTPFSYNEFQQINLVNSERGKQLYDEIGKRHNIVILPCAITGIQLCGWWRTVPQKLRDLRGLKMRFTGLSAEIFKRLGALPRQDIEFDQLHQALKTRMIDVVEWTTPADDLRQKFYQYAPHTMVPGWHEPGSVMQLIINRKTWQSLSVQQQEDIKDACQYTFIRMAALYHLLDGQAIIELKRLGVQFHQWSNEFLQAFYHEYQALAAQYRKQDPLFDQLYQLMAEETVAFDQYQSMQQTPLAHFVHQMLATK